ncbi:hypothetical protein B296_00034401 [Ensete ventricosum]|uniref:Uncharacterized protein n=1 Tax=Ensete ventricosum TaxID=4639 RepID=A0A426Y9T7_ENSVE|nr:hypothetical protein B296_00034401 [Ensete ventricosum]
MMTRPVMVKTAMVEQNLLRQKQLRWSKTHYEGTRPIMVESHYGENWHHKIPKIASRRLTMVEATIWNKTCYSGSRYCGSSLRYIPKPIMMDDQRPTMVESTIAEQDLLWRSLKFTTTDEQRLAMTKATIAKRDLLRRKLL